MAEISAGVAKFLEYEVRPWRHFRQLLVRVALTAHVELFGLGLTVRGTLLVGGALGIKLPNLDEGIMLVTALALDEGQGSRVRNPQDMYLGTHRLTGRESIVISPAFRTAECGRT